MPDISMCRGRDNCPLCKTCYRRTATPSGDRQSWFAEPPAEQVRAEWEPRGITVQWRCDEQLPMRKKEQP